MVMKKIQSALILLMALGLSSFTLFKSIEWSISENYSIKFNSDNPSGVFKSFKGKILFDPDNLSQSEFNLTVDVNSINTGNGMKNKHALSDEWFDAKQFPEITFKSNDFKKDESGYLVRGVMTIHGISKEMTIPFDFVNNTFNSSFKVNRTDFNVGSTKGMSAKASTELTIDVNVPVTQK